MKYIIVTGGVLSGLGKGITTASIGSLLKSKGYSITAMKIDPYLNCDAGTMNPIQHGEVFVLEDGGEVDLDLGNYERFLNVSLGRDNNLTTGRAYKAVIENERRGEYLGKTVQIIPHVTDYIKSSIVSVGEKANADVMLVEIGGTVGDIESMPFIEAMRQLRNEVGNENLVFVHVTLVPVVGAVGEQKTKPTQHSVSELRSIGIQPDIIVARSKSMLGAEARQKISLFCDVPSEAVISVPDADTIYRVPLIIDEQHLTTYLLKRLGLKSKNEDLKEWRAFVERIANPRKSVTIAVVGKYINLKDSYLSISEAFTHAGAELGAKVNIIWIEAEDCVEMNIDKRLSNVDGVLVPGGFGLRGTEGKICAIKYAREHNIPFLGICYGFQLAIIEFCRNVIGWKDADTTENNAKTLHPVIDLLPEQKSVKDLGGTMRLGAYPVKITKNTRAYELYKEDKISERHRHRYEVNPVFIDKIEDAGLLFSGRSLDGTRMEIAELPSNSYFIASQFHPEFKSRPNDPAKLFLGLLRAAFERKNSD